jgi:protocatechuate 3,4-dioxygenase alpha subunit
MMSEGLLLTPSQTVGPFFGFALPYARGETLVAQDTRGERIAIHGIVRDGDGFGIDDALIEIWQANAAGRYAHADDDRSEIALDPAFIGFGRCPTDLEGRYRFTTIRPGRVPGPDGAAQAPHVAVSVLARGLLKRLATRLYFGDEAANDDDAILAMVDPARRSTLIARREGAEPLYRFDIVLQGDGETVFFAY